MKVLVDTNVIIDILEKREEFFQASYEVARLAVQGRIQAFMPASAVTDVYYIIHQSVHDAEKSKEAIIGLTTLVGLCDTMAGDIHAALSLPVNDFEDAVIAAIAKRERADYIVTRNEADFRDSPVPAVSPAAFLEHYKE
ncbi:MAG: PIN domain-containing protein [Spirochaetaceae bacterium]|jgi:predicted nucleic acid-binding protein|nr:PIN domain-containing protein [Spirochaetaceae bacterium]